MQNMHSASDFRKVYSKPFGQDDSLLATPVKKSCLENEHTTLSKLCDIDKDKSRLVDELFSEFVSKSLNSVKNTKEKCDKSTKHKKKKHKSHHKSSKGKQEPINHTHGSGNMAFGVVDSRCENHDDHSTDFFAKEKFLLDTEECNKKSKKHKKHKHKRKSHHSKQDNVYMSTSVTQNVSPSSTPNSGEISAANTLDNRKVMLETKELSVDLENEVAEHLEKAYESRLQSLKKNLSKKQKALVGLEETYSIPEKRIRLMADIVVKERQKEEEVELARLASLHKDNNTKEPQNEWNPPVALKKGNDEDWNIAISTDQKKESKPANEQKEEKECGPQNMPGDKHEEENYKTDVKRPPLSSQIIIGKKTKTGLRLGLKISDLSAQLISSGQMSGHDCKPLEDGELTDSPKSKATDSADEVNDDNSDGTIESDTVRTKKKHTKRKSHKKHSKERSKYNEDHLQSYSKDKGVWKYSKRLNSQERIHSRTRSSKRSRSPPSQSHDGSRSPNLSRSHKRSWSLHRSRSPNQSRLRHSSRSPQRSRSPRQGRSHHRSRSQHRSRSPRGSYRRSRTPDHGDRKKSCLQHDDFRTGSKDKLDTSHGKQPSPPSTDLRVKIDKARLRAIAYKNVYGLLSTADISLKPEQVAAIKAGGKSVNELIDYCRNIQEKSKGVGSLSSSEEDDVPTVQDCDEQPFIHHPFKLKESILPLIVNIKNARQLPVQSSAERVTQQAELRLQFPVSSGNQHKTKEKEWVPVEPPTPATKPAAPPTVTAVVTTTNVVPQSIVPVPTPAENIFASPLPTVAVDVGTVVAERLEAMRRLESNPNDVQAMNKLHRVQTQMNSWVQSKQLPGQFTGNTGLTTLSNKQLLQGGHQPWVRKDLLLTAAPLQSGIGKLLLQKMGWQEGTGLGRDNSGALEPLALEVKTDRKGLVGEGEGKKHVPAPRAKAEPIRDLSGKHPVTAVTELCKRRHWGTPQFELVVDDGPAHLKSFIFEVTVNKVVYRPTVGAPNKKLAKAQAATVCLQEMGLVPREHNM